MREFFATNVPGYTARSIPFSDLAVGDLLFIISHTDVEIQRTCTGDELAEHVRARCELELEIRSLGLSSRRT